MPFRPFHPRTVPLRVGALLLACVGPVTAERHLMLANQGREPLCVEGTSVRGGVAPGAWQEPSGGRPRPDLECRYLVEPGERIEFLRTNWDQGVPDGSSSWFSTRVRSVDGERIELAHKLDGETIGSNLWRRVGGSTWVDDDAPRTHAWVRRDGAAPIEVVVDGRRVEYRFGAVRPVPATTDPEGFRVLAFNAALLPAGGTGVEARAARLAEVLGGHDALVLSELFADDARERLLRDLSPEYPWQTSVLEDDDPLAQDGGVVIVSRWPILHQAEHFYTGGVGTDSLSAKGAMVASIRGPQGILHLVGTHTQSDADGWADSVIDGIAFPGVFTRPAPAAVRDRQFRSLEAFLAGLGLPEDEPLVIAGDLNVARASTREFEAMLRTLGAVEPAGDREGPTWDPGNELVADGDRPARLDYLLVSLRHRGIDPAASRTEVVRLRSPTPWDGSRTDLSDHYAVSTRLQFAGGKSAAAFPAGPEGADSGGFLGQGE